MKTKITSYLPVLFMGLMLCVSTVWAVPNLQDTQQTITLTEITEAQAQELRNTSVAPNTAPNAERISFVVVHRPAVDGSPGAFKLTTSPLVAPIKLITWHTGTGKVFRIDGFRNADQTERLWYIMRPFRINDNEALWELHDGGRLARYYYGIAENRLISQTLTNMTNPDQLKTF